MKQIPEQVTWKSKLYELCEDICYSVIESAPAFELASSVYDSVGTMSEETAEYWYRTIQQLTEEENKISWDKNPAPKRE